jgi:pimeloyl-ACP methyl ester carboxylesterase
MTSLQTQLLFPTDAVPPAGPFPANGERLQARTPEGDMLHGVYLKPDKDVAGLRTLILGFGGNAWNAQEVAEYLHEAFPDGHVVAFHYRGYRPSTGNPSADALLADAPLVLHVAVARVRPDRTVIVGFSIGSGVAASLGHNADVDGLILVTPFDSLKAVAAQLYPWLPVGPFFQHEIDTVELLRGSRLPVAIVAAERDEIIPPPRTEALRERIGNLALDRTIAGTGHNDIYWRNEFRDALRDACDTILPK